MTAPGSTSSARCRSACRRCRRPTCRRHDRPAGADRRGRGAAGADRGGVDRTRRRRCAPGQRIDGNQEFIGQGLSNMAGAFFSGYASSGSFNRSGLNYDAGARTPLAAVFRVAVPARHPAVPGAAGQVPADPGDGRHAVRRRLGPDRLPPDRQAAARQPRREHGADRDPAGHADPAARIRDLPRRAAVAADVPVPHGATVRSRTSSPFPANGRRRSAPPPACPTARS